MIDSLPSITIESLVLPVADAAAAELTTAVMHREMERLWLEDRAAGLDWRNSLNSITLVSGEMESPEAIGRRLASAVRARLVREPQS